jgi:N-acetylmuramoyl-L-alanine amidase
VASLTHPAAVRRIGVLVGLALALVALVGAPSARAQAAGCSPAVPGRPIVVLDPGHGGSDTGTSNYGGGKLLVEKDLTLDIAKRTSDILISAPYTYQVCLTRTTDVEMSNTQRAQYANSVGGSVLVLIHLNGSSNHSVDYTQTFWGKKNKDLQFSTAIYNALKANLGIPGNGVGQFASGALLKSNMPATLAESVFLTNDQEATQLADDSPANLSPNSRRQQIAKALVQGIYSWLH